MDEEELNRLEFEDVVEEEELEQMQAAGTSSGVGGVAGEALDAHRYGEEEESGRPAGIVAMELN